MGSVWEFTYRGFARFCQQAARNPVFTVAQHLTAPAPAAPFSVLRLDVDYWEAHAVEMARIAARHQVRGTFYFRRHAHGFPFAAMRAVRELGHEIGYHFETLDTCGGNVRSAAEQFLRYLDEMRTAGFEVTTAAAHGSRPVAPTYRANFDLFTLRPDLLAEAGLLGETTLSMDFTQVIYTSDALWRWRRYPYYVYGAVGEPTSLRVILRVMAAETTGLYFNFHPHQWFASPLQAQFYRARNRIGRIVKPHLSGRPRS